MKKSKKILALLLIALVSTAMVFNGCKKKDDPAPTPTPTPTTGVLTVIVKAASGWGIDVNNTAVGIYKDTSWDNPIEEGTATGSSTQAQATFANLNPDTYYVACIKVIPDGTIYYGWDNTGTTVTAGGTATSTITIPSK
ncbi:MAG: hypothetical protein K9G58_01695 [Bacteroidales bacterium]|mgnify:CR=1 FL=1|nr:hypothetical protein [Bacteroidales bacterium]MCF8396850.1 hypothetical protein [Bacteroidales bacterium]